jgi:UDP-glucuronate decarboxylase
LTNGDQYRGSVKMQVLVTGGAGFLGSNLIRRLIKQDCQIICYDNLYTGRIENINEFKGLENFQFIEGDVENLLDFKVDQIYNLACPASPKAYQADPIKTMKTSVIGTLNVLELASKTNARVLHASTSEIYGDPLVSPQVESYWGNVNSIGVRSCYDEGKRAAETLCFDFLRCRNLDARVVRIFNTYGPGMQIDDGRVVSNFIVQALKGEPLTVYGSGKQTRSFCFVTDLISGFISLMNLENNPNRPINLGNPNEFNMLELASKIIDLTESNSRIVYEDLPLDDPKQRRPNIEAAWENLRWRPIVELDEGLVQTVSYFKQLLGGSN